MHMYIKAIQCNGYVLQGAAGVTTLHTSPRQAPKPSGVAPEMMLSKTLTFVGGGAGWGGLGQKFTLRACKR